MSNVVPFNRPHLTGVESGYLAEAMRGGHLAGDGPFTSRAEQLLSKITGVADVLLTTSCTHALEMAAILLALDPGDEVLVPSFTFSSTANAFAGRGARPVFIDIRPDTLNIDERLIEAALTERTRAIVVVHYGGVACEMDPILEIAAARGITVIEDNAHGLGATLGGQPLGTFGALAAQSFHQTKNIQCGEGGALLINNPDLVDRSHIVRQSGTNRTAFLSGAIDRYTWVDTGSSYLLSDLLAAFLLAQLEHFDRIQSRRHHIWSTYERELNGWASEVGVGLPVVPSSCEHAAHSFHVLLADLEERTAFIANLADRGVQSAFHYVALHRSPMGLKLGGAHARCPVTEAVSDGLARLPLYPDLSESDQARAIEAVTTFRPRRRHR